MLYFIQAIEKISIHRFVPLFRKHVKLRPHLEYERTFNKSFFMFLHEMKILVHNNKKEIF